VTDAETAAANRIERHTLAVLVVNEPGVLARVIGLFAGRGYNIESLTVAEVEREKGLSRITLVTSGTRMIIDQIKTQLERLVPIRRVRDLTEEGPFVGRELALVKIVGESGAENARRRASSIPANPVSYSKSPNRPKRSTSSWR
jgi:acetolactate synthase small subunit